MRFCPCFFCTLNVLCLISVIATTAIIHYHCLFAPPPNKRILEGLSVLWLGSHKPNPWFCLNQHDKQKKYKHTQEIYRSFRFRIAWIGKYTNWLLAYLPTQKTGISLKVLLSYATTEPKETCWTQPSLPTLKEKFPMHSFHGKCILIPQCIRSLCSVAITIPQFFGLVESWWLAIMWED